MTSVLPVETSSIVRGQSEGITALPPLSSSTSRSSPPLSSDYPPSLSHHYPRRSISNLSPDGSHPLLLASPSSHTLHAAIQKRKIKEKKSRIQQTFFLISSALIVLLFSVLLYYNYIMLSPHIHSLFWALLWSFVLTKPQQWLLWAFHWMDDRLTGKQQYIVFTATMICFPIIAFSPSVITLLVVSILYGLLLLFLFGGRHHLVSVFLLLCVILILVFPLFFFLKTCVEEAQEMVNRVKIFINNNPQFELLIKDFTQSSLYHRGLNYAQSWYNIYRYIHRHI